MNMQPYSDEVMDHFKNPRNVGEILDADGIGEVGNPVCGDMMTFYIKVKDNKLSDVRFKTFGCGAAIAVSSMTSEIAKGKTIEEALQITRESIAQRLGGLPPQKMHCSNLGADALHRAIKDYQSKQAQKSDAKPTKCSCPYCKGPIDENMSFCKPCNKDFIPCPKCGKPVASSITNCPNCQGALS